MVNQVQSGDVVGNYECPSCGAEVNIKVNKKGGLCAICTNIVRPDGQGNKKYCWDRHTFSPYAVSEIIKDYLEGKELQNVKTKQKQANIGHKEREEGSTAEIGASGFNEGGDVGESNAPTIPPESRGIGGAIKQFLNSGGDTYLD